MINANNDTLITMPVGRLLLIFSLPAIGKAKKAAFLGLSRQVLLLIPLLLILPNLFGLNGVWGASALADLISSLIAIVSLKSAFSHLNKLQNEYRSKQTETMSFVAQ